MKKILSLLCVFVFVLTGCFTANNSVETYIVPTTEIEGLDTAYMSYSDTFKVAIDVFDGLYEVNGDGELVPALAETYEISDDGLTITITIKEGTYWYDHTGEIMAEVTAHDFEYAWKRMVDPATASFYSSVFFPIKNYEEVISGEIDVDEFGVTAVDDYTLVIELDEPCSYFQSMLAFGSYMPVSQEAVELYGDDYGRSAETTWYNGPFYVSEYDSSISIMLLAAPNYYDADVVELEGVEYRTMTDSELIYNSFMNGEIDYAIVPTNDDYIAHGDDINNAMTSYIYFLWPNHEGEHTSNKDFRYALAYGMDRESIINSVYGRGYDPVNYFIPEGITTTAYDGLEYRDYAYTEDDFISYDLDIALEYLDKYMADAGIENASDIELTLLVSETTDNQQLAEAIQAHYTQTLGITINIDVQPTTSAREKAKTGDYDLYVGGWGADYPDPSTYFAILLSSSIEEFNYARWNSPEYDEMYEVANSIQDPISRFEAFAELEYYILVEEVVMIPIYQRNDPYLISDHYTIGYHSFMKISNKYTTVDYSN